MQYSNISILGAGWAGLLLAKKIIESSVNDISLIEATNKEELGGLLRTEVIDGFTFDCGGPHLLFSRNEKILSEITDLLRGNCSKRFRNNFVFYKNQYIPYPFENGIYRLSPDERIKFVKGIIERMISVSKNTNWKPNNFLEWITGFFGDYMADEYLIPYNKKIWKRPLDKMASDWVFTPGRLPFPELENMLSTVAGIANIGYKEQSYFYYPNSGGISTLFYALYNMLAEKGVNFILGERVSRLITKPEGNCIINNKIGAKKVISTIPLPELLLSLDYGNDYRKLSERFDYNSVAVIGIAIKRKTPNRIAIYVPDPKIIFHRYTWMSSLSPQKDEEVSNLIAEVTIPKGEGFDQNKMRKDVIQGLLDMHVVEDEKEILFTKMWFNRYGYPIYSIDHNEIREEVMHVLNAYGIKTVGRWGSWHYWNTDMVLKEVNELLG